MRVDQLLAKSKNPSVADAVRLLKKMGFAVVGRSVHNGTVALRRGNSLYKATFDRALTDWCQACKVAGGRNPSLPRIYEVRTFPGFSSFSSLSLIRTEPLAPIESAPIRMQELATDLLLLFGNNLDNLHRALNSDFVRSAEKKAPGIGGAFRLAVGMTRDGRYYMDMHKGNIMWRRSTRSLVLNDPLC